MIVIAHRGNINGPNPEMENHPEYIESALHMGYDVEVDVWSVGGKFFLGHDEPKHEIDWKLLNRSGLWCHAKNSSALSAMLFMGVHCFWHQEDDYTITSKGYIWSHPKADRNRSAVQVELDFSPALVGQCLGICSDHVAKYRNISPDGSKK